MGKLDRIAALLLALGPLACSAREPPEWAREASRAEQGQSARTPVEPVDPRFDAEGKLKPSGTRVSWLELPSGFRERPGNTERMAAYEAEQMPFDKVRAYLEERLAPKNALYLPSGFAYREARPTHTALDLPPLHVTVLDTDRERAQVRLVIEGLSDPNPPPLPPAAAAELLAKRRRQQE